MEILCVCVCVPLDMLFHVVTLGMRVCLSIWGFELGGVSCLHCFEYGFVVHTGTNCYQED